ncbi:MAG: hypothetical protein HZC51_07995, partial [Nitrospirae bacterium]|nr:hypothetical protein [Nitrospirota bacterium]
MKTYILPFGGHAWGRRREILREIVSGSPGPPYDYGHILYLAPNEQKLRTLKVTFLEALEEVAGAKGCIPPRFIVLNQFIRSHVVPASSRPVVDDMTRGLVIEELCVKAAGRIGASGLSPEAAGPSLARPVADALDLLYLHGVEDGRARAALGDGMPARILMDVKREYESWLRRHGLADLSALKGSYRPVPDTFAGHGLVVMDGFYDADPCETRVLSALAASAGECIFLLEAPGLGSPGSTGPGMPYFGADLLMRALGADGGQAESPSPPAILYSSTIDPPPLRGRVAQRAGLGGNEVLPQGERGATTDDAEADAYIGALFAGRHLNGSLAAVRALAPDGREVRVEGALNPAEEVCRIAGDIKESYLNGGLPDLGRVLVFFPSPDGYLPLVEEAFRDMGIPYYLSQGKPLAQSPVVAALMNILALPVDGYTYRGIRRVLSSQ